LKTIPQIEVISGNSSSQGRLATATPVLMMAGEMIPQARMAPPTEIEGVSHRLELGGGRYVQKLQEALRPLSIPAPKKAGVN